jgi:hypothetical protein
MADVASMEPDIVSTADSAGLIECENSADNHGQARASKRPGTTRRPRADFPPIWAQA